MQYIDGRSIFGFAISGISAFVSFTQVRDAVSFLAAIIACIAGITTIMYNRQRMNKK